MLIGLAVIVIFFSFKADNFLSPGNFSNIITQMAGATLLAYGVVFVLLIGEIDLSISYISGIAGVVVAELTAAGRERGRGDAWRSCSRSRSCALIGVFQGSFVAFIGVPAFVVTLAGLPDLAGRDPEVDRGRGRDRDPGHTVNNTANYFFSEKAGWIIAAVVIGIYVVERRRPA